MIKADAWTVERDTNKALLKKVDISAKGTSHLQSLWLSNCKEKTPYRKGFNMGRFLIRTAIPLSTVLTFRLNSIRWLARFL